MIDFPRACLLTLLLLLLLLPWLLFPKLLVCFHF
jgi:hypothetical protein